MTELLDERMMTLQEADTRLKAANRMLREPSREELDVAFELAACGDDFDPAVDE